MDNVYTVFLRGKNGKPKQRMFDISSLDIVEKLNDSGSWVIKSKTADRCPFQAGDGIIVFCKGDYYYSGVLKKIEETFDGWSGLYEWTASGASDLDYLTRRVVYPDPVEGHTDQSGYYIDTGLISEVVKRLIDKNLGIEAMDSRVEPMIEGTRIDDIGNQVAIEIRFENLFDCIVRMLEEQVMTIRCGWDYENEKVFYQIYDSKDLSGMLLFSSSLNALQTMDYSLKSPDGNYVISAGEGELTARSFAYAENEASVTKWGRIEYYHDMRSTEDADLQTDADTTLADISDAEEGYSGEMVAGQSMPQYRKDWNLGDFVAVAHRSEVMVQRVLQVETNISVNSETIKPTIGTIPEGKIHEIFREIKRLKSDVAQLQRVSE